MKDLSAFWAGVLAGKRITWANHVNLLLCMVILHGFISIRAYRSLLEIVLGHLTLMILPSSFLWNTSALFSRVCVNVHSSEGLRQRPRSRVCVNVHSSELYMKILWMYVANTLDFFSDMLATENRFECLVSINGKSFWLFDIQCRVVIGDICISFKHLLHLFVCDTFLFCFHLHGSLLWAT